MIVRKAKLVRRTVMKKITMAAVIAAVVVVVASMHVTAQTTFENMKASFTDNMKSPVSPEDILGLNTTLSSVSNYEPSLERRAAIMAETVDGKLVIALKRFYYNSDQNIDNAAKALSETIRRIAPSTRVQMFPAMIVVNSFSSDGIAVTHSIKADKSQYQQFIIIRTVYSTGEVVYTELYRR